MASKKALKQMQEQITDRFDRAAVQLGKELVAAGFEVYDVVSNLADKCSLSEDLLYARIAPPPPEPIEPIEPTMPETPAADAVDEPTLDELDQIEAEVSTDDAPLPLLPPDDFK